MQNVMHRGNWGNRRWKMRLCTLPQKFCLCFRTGRTGRTRPGHDAADASVNENVLLIGRRDKTKTRRGYVAGAGTRGTDGAASRLVPVQLERDAPKHIDRIQPEESKRMTTRKGRLVPGRDGRRGQ